ncbi:inner-membrane translocator [Stappia sp. 22II-S9-Z10]|nr:inner-membrane translocator [Stappia sp. 22II-S9-Z10]
MRRLVDPTIIAILAGALALTFAHGLMPGWVIYMLQLALAAALPALGCMILLRSGLLTFGQGLFYFIGAYGVALTQRHLGLTDAFAGLLLGALASALVAAIVGTFLARYRGIFFAMLTLALSMVVYGIAIKMDLFGRSDGLNVSRLTYLGVVPGREWATPALFVFCIWVFAAAAVMTHLYLTSRFGRMLSAIHDNETRVEYLGWSVAKAVHVSFIVAAVLASLGGTLAAAAARYADPSLAFWTTSGEFVFIVLISGIGNVLSPLFGSVFLEALRAYASTHFPDEWQLVLGAVMLVIILFLPKGLGHLFVLAKRAVVRPAAGKSVPANAKERS